MALPKSQHFYPALINKQRKEKDINWLVLCISFFIPAAATAGIYFFVFEVSFLTTFLEVHLANTSLVSSFATLIIVGQLLFALCLSPYLGLNGVFMFSIFKRE